ncbi:MAG: glycosyltransferase family 2 protein [Pirellulaceae bacterium]
MAKVAVIMACYNARNFLPEAINSVLNQTFRDFQLIVVNDGSTDGSAEYLEERRQQDPRMVVAHQKNQGQQAAANLAISISDSEYIARMDADDITTEDRLAKQVAFLDSNRDIGLSGGQIKRMGSRKAGLISNLPLAHEEIVRGLLRNQHTLCNPTTMFRRVLFQQIGGYWKHNIAEDWDMFLRLAQISRLANQPDCFLFYRLHTQSVNGRRIVDAQLHNEYAAALYLLREARQPEISYEEFLRDHRSRRWPQSWLFYLDALAIGEYREAVAEIYSGQPIKGYSRLAFSMSMSPMRTIRRIANMLRRK